MMELLTLSELNRAFMAGNTTPAQDIHPEKSAKLEPITPIVIEVDRKNGIKQETKKETKGKSSGVFAFISNVIFYLAIVLIMLTVLTSGTDAGVPKTIFGYSYFTVVSNSMQDEIPKGSFILVKNIEPQNLKIGDTITYMRDRNTSVTHKVADIYENYNNSGSRGFQTKGVNNANPDADVVHGSTIVGKVVFVLPAVGEFMSYLAANVYIVFIIFGLCVIISFCLRGLLVKPKKEKQLTNKQQEEH